MNLKEEILKIHREIKILQQYRDDLKQELEQIDNEYLIRQAQNAANKGALND
jgi:hypothetical protein